MKMRGPIRWHWLSVLGRLFAVACLGGAIQLIITLYAGHHKDALSFFSPPQPGTVTYRADFTKGIDGWSAPLPVHLRATEGALAIDTWGYPQWFAALPPHQPSTKNYEVTTDISVSVGGLFGLEVRGTSTTGYDVTIQYLNAQDGVARIYADIPNEQPVELAWSSFPTDRSIPEYKVDVRGDKISLLIDGEVVVSATDDLYTGPGQVYIWAQATNILVRSFDITVI
jgi:hypothetical protein